MIPRWLLPRAPPALVRPERMHTVLKSLISHARIREKPTICQLGQKSARGCRGDLITATSVLQTEPLLAPLLVLSVAGFFVARNASRPRPTRDLIEQDSVTSTNRTVTLYRPVGPKELDLIRQSGFRAFPPRLPEQPIFYPVLTEDYAVKIARDWNVKASGAGFVTRFAVLASFLEAYPVQQAGGASHLENWIPAEHLPAFNAGMVGQIEVIAEFRAVEGT